jgi:hypothetical protein
MAQVSKVPVSRLIKQGEDEDGPTKKSRDEYRKAKELEEARYDTFYFFVGGKGYRFGNDRPNRISKLLTTKSIRNNIFRVTTSRAVILNVYS